MFIYVYCDFMFVWFLISFNKNTFVCDGWTQGRLPGGAERARQVNTGAIGGSNAERCGDQKQQQQAGAHSITS